MSAGAQYGRDRDGDLAEIDELRGLLQQIVRDRGLAALALSIGECTARLRASRYHEALAAEAVERFGAEVATLWDDLVEGRLDRAELEAGER